MEQPTNSGNLSDHLANERTFLAWMRTGIGIMAFGFVVVKFSLFVKQVSLLLGKQAIAPYRGDSALLGIALVGVGTLAIVFSYIRYRVTEKQIDEGAYKHSRGWLSTLTAIMFLVSIALIAYLISSI